jgi:hypothetical protein
MGKLRLVLVGAIVAAWSMSFAAPAGAVVCVEEPGSCCESVEVLGKEVLHIDC